MKDAALILVSGWAHPPAALDGLAARLSSGFAVKTTSTHELCVKSRNSASPYVEGLVALLEEAGGKPIVVGWSMGGMVALETAARRPESIGALVLIGASARFCRDQDFPEGVPAPHVRAMAQELKRDRRLTLKRFFERAAAPGIEPEAALEAKLSAAGDISVGELIRGLEYLERFDVRSELPRIKTRALALHGKNDGVVPWQAAGFLGARLPSCLCAWDYESGHDLPVRNPEPAALKILAFAGAGGRVDGEKSKQHYEE